MKKFLNFLLTVLLSLIIGFWLSEKQVLEGTKAGDVLTSLTERIPVPAAWDVNQPELIKDKDLTTEAFKEKLEKKETAEQDTSPAYAIDAQAVENRIFERLNNLRKEKNVPLLKKNEVLKQAADERARETEESFSHTRPDGTETFTVLTEPEHEYDYRLAGENLAMGTYIGSEEKMADLLFDGWVDSKGHYENMIQPDFQEVGIGVHYDGKNLYATQLFGTPL